MTRAVIIDDEINSRDSIRQMLLLYCNDVTVVGEADGVNSGIVCINDHKPDLVFLDIKMPDGSGFELLKRINKIDFQVIFVTAFEEYAIKAFRFNAIDYITKPIDPEELRQAVEKAGKYGKDSNTDETIKLLLESISRTSQNHRRIILRTLNTIHVIEIERIIRCESDRNYTVFHIVGEDKLMISRTLKDFDELLEEYGFFRVHNSHMINLNFVRKFHRDELLCILTDGTTIPVSYRKRDELLAAIKNL